MRRQPNKKHTSVEEKITKILNKRVAEKYITPAIIGTSSSSTVYTDVSDIGQGTTILTRTGGEIRLKRFVLRWNAVVADVTNLIRVILFVWKPSSTSDTPSDAELFNDPSDTTRKVISPTLPLKPSRFRILKDSTVMLDSYHQQRCGDFSIDLGDLKVSYDLGVNTGVNHLYLAVVSDSSAVSHPTFNYEMLLYFSDVL